MTNPVLPPITTLPTLSAAQRAQVLDLLFEPSTQLHTLSVERLGNHSATHPPFSDYTALIATVRDQLYQLDHSTLESDRKWLLAILGSHPRLGAAKVDSALSRAEQAHLQESRAGDGTPGATMAAVKPADDAERQREEAEKLERLNQEYEAKFPGLIYVVFVNGRSRSVIMDDMARRIATSTLEKEKEEAIEAMCLIALDRAKKLGGIPEGHASV